MAQKEEMGLLNTKLQVLQAELVKKQQAAADYEKQFEELSEQLAAKQNSWDEQHTLL